MFRLLDLAQFLNGILRSQLKVINRRMCTAKDKRIQKAVELLQEEYGQKTDNAADYLSFLKAGQDIKGTYVNVLTKLAKDMTKCGKKNRV